MLLGTRLVIVLFNRKPPVGKDESETCSFEEFVFDWEMYFRFYEVYCFQNLVGLELPIKYTLIARLYVIYYRTYHSLDTR